MFKKYMMAVMVLFLLTACSNKEDLDAQEREKIIEEGTAGFEMMGDTIEKAKDVPADEEKAIVAAFEEYIAALNAEEVDRYMQSIAKNPKGFQYEEEKAFVADIFTKFDTKREVDNITITKYSPEEAQVFATISTNSLQLETKVQHESAGRQVTVFVKEDDNWKVTSVYYIGDDSQSSTAN
ncbi:DUF3225 domain-containing protein [Lysinibacillus piscis]|uniref:DUF3225 domain-containing protein n=1 Tax=Lysinibacillus piscis TaxID=2518931 RepID=A0ABQ5NHJ8_9BACI|nr:DUF3225 domain-containing protein [Lysinibacillus sp. KH24]GLC87840.1 hypothetical protein LYSBPC_09670 [Lysinibacillus sp. KH24]